MTSYIHFYTARNSWTLLRACQFAGVTYNYNMWHWWKWRQAIIFHCGLVLKGFQWIPLSISVYIPVYYMFAMWTHIQMHMSTQAIPICFVNCLEVWINKASSWAQRIWSVSKMPNFCFGFQRIETIYKSDFDILKKWGHLYFIEKLHLK